MSDQHRYIIVRESRVPTMHAWLLNNPYLDPRGGGDKTFSVLLQLTTDPPETVRARICCWKLPPSWWLRIRDKVRSLGWKINTTDADNDVSHYKYDDWAWEDILADTTKKPFALQLVPPEEPIP